MSLEEPVGDHPDELQGGREEAMRSKADTSKTPPHSG